jgi:hypothetical protein
VKASGKRRRRDSVELSETDCDWQNSDRQQAADSGHIIVDGGSHACVLIAGG